MRVGVGVGDRPANPKRPGIVAVFCSPSVSTSTRSEFPGKTSPDRSCPRGQPLPFHDDPSLPESLPGRVFLYTRVQTRSTGLSTDFPGVYASFAQLSGDQTRGRARCWDGTRRVRSVDTHLSSSNGRIGVRDAGPDHPGRCSVRSHGQRGWWEEVTQLCRVGVSLGLSPC